MGCLGLGWGCWVFVWLVGVFLVLFSSCATSGGKTQASPLFLGGAVMELACACLLVRLFAAQSSGQPRVVPTVKQIWEASLQDPRTVVWL